MKNYIALEDITLYEDCSFSSKILGNLSKGRAFEVLEKAGAWFEIQLDGNKYWIFTYNKSSSCVVEEVEESKVDIRIGDLITVDTKAAFTKDHYGKVLNTRKGYTPILYQVEGIVQNPTRVEFNSNGTLYSLPIESVSKFSANSVSSYAVKANNVQTYDTSSGGDGSSKDATSDVTDKVKEDQQNAKKEQEDIINSFVEKLKNSFDEFNKVNDKAVLEGLDKLRISTLKSVFGMPYQFLPIADMRLDSKNPSTTDYDTFGRKYAEKIVARMPLLVLIPGTAEFMSKYTSSERDKVIGALSGDLGLGSSDSKELDDILSDSGQYYSFYQDWVTYYKYVNPLCHIAAALMKVNDIKYPTSNGGEKPLSEFNWKDNSDPTISNILGYNRGGCAYYINSDNQITETFSNETTKTQLADKINSISDKVREMQFLMGNIAASSVGINFIRRKSEAELRNDKNTEKERANTSTNIFGNHANNNVFGSIINGAGAIIEGSKMRFPEIWSDSSFSKDYNISIKLTSPDCDNLSLYLNIIVPLIHLICLAAPRGAGPNVYTSPFLIRCTYRGFYNIDMGIITSMSIRKGGEGKWSYAGVPTEVEVDITIKDLYDMMELAINNSEDFQSSMDVNVLSNTSLMDYLSNMCGININEPDIARTLILYKIIYTNKFKSIIPNIGDSLNQWIYNKYINLGIL